MWAHIQHATISAWGVNQRLRAETDWHDMRWRVQGPKWYTLRPQWCILRVREPVYDTLTSLRTKIMMLFVAKMMHFESTRAVMTHLDKFKDQNDKFHEYEAWHIHTSLMAGHTLYPHSQILSNWFWQYLITIRVMDFLSRSVLTKTQHSD